VRALSIAEQTFGPDHPRVGITLNNLANVYQAEGRYAEAEALYERAKSLPGWEVVNITVQFATNRRMLASKELLFSSDPVTKLKDMILGTAIVRAPKAEVLNRAERIGSAFGQLDRAGGRQTMESDLSLHERSRCYSLISRGRWSCSPTVIQRRRARSSIRSSKG
jgi:tetratricopeptide (TPR) repeat protein